MPNAFKLAVSKAAAKDGAVPNVVGKTQASGVKPSSAGIASRRIDNRRIVATHRAIQIADTLGTMLKARDGADPEAAALANNLLANPQFMLAFKKLLDDVQSAIPSLAKPAAAAPAKSASGTPHGGPDYPESNSPNNRPTHGQFGSSNLPGTDAAPGGIPVALASFLVDAPDSDSFDARRNAAIDAEAAARRLATIASVKAHGTAEDKARVACGLDPRLGGLDQFWAEPEAPSRPSRPHDR